MKTTVLSAATLCLVSSTASAADTAAKADATSAKADDTPATAHPTPATADPTPPSGKIGIVPFALIGYQPESSVILGTAAVGVYRYPPDSGRRDSKVLVAGAVSIKKQLTLHIGPDVYLANDSIHAAGTLEFSRAPNEFFGIGSDTKKEDKEEYTLVTFEFDVNPKIRVVPGMYWGPQLRFTSTSMVDTEAGGVLEEGSVPGSAGGRTVEVGVAGFYDTRDETIYPRAGHIVNAFARMAMPALGSDFEYVTGGIDARKYVSLPWDDRHVLALQVLAELRSGAPPFYELGLMGGDETMRGYFEGRFRDRNYLATQVEYRMPLFWRFGAVAFASAGQVSHTLSDVGSAPVKFAGGGGLRFAPVADVPVNLRVDIAYGNELLFYVNLGEAF